ncbi:MAG TPA: DUF6152 family protein [Candidatus Baltobacteraceae bacterium]|nr:DUF6152 family protein [Candidatus Baltobacteraceae bacterium]
MRVGWKGWLFRCGIVAAALSALMAPAVRAHHSGAIFDMAHPVTISGVVTKVEWTNPHAYFYLNVTDAKGEVHEWAIETNSPNFLKHNGWTSTTLNPGDKIVCTGAPARTGAYFMHATMVQLPNGSQLRS